MYTHFSNYISDNQLLNPSDKILLTVSGGIDSMVMLHLFQQSVYSFAIAHCNFQLRGEEADLDEQFIKQYADRFHISIYINHFDTKGYAETNKISIQMAARELRYTWFEELAETYNYQRIATAHHLDDAIETFFVNMLRKTGLKGLQGINADSGKIIRPLLFTTRKDIESYAVANNIAFREDKSNKNDYYTRNYIRLHIIPLFRKLQDNFEESMHGTMHILRQQHEVYADHIESVKAQIMKPYQDGYAIDLKKLKTLAHVETYLFECLFPFGINAAQIDDILEAIDNEPGRIFTSKSHRILKDRNFILIRPLSSDESPEIKIDYNFKDNCMYCASLAFELVNDRSRVTYKDANQNVAYIDASKLTFPLYIRKWKYGDIFYPFGMKGKKKLSDYFTDLKLSLFEKEKINILCNSNGDIVWIIGKRSDNRYKITARTNKILKITQY